MTNAEALAIYKAAFGRPESEGDPPDGHLELTRWVVTAPDLEAATKILRKAGWYYPDGHAIVLREAVERTNKESKP